MVTHSWYGCIQANQILTFTMRNSSQHQVVEKYFLSPKPIHLRSISSRNRKVNTSSAVFSTACKTSRCCRWISSNTCSHAHSLQILHTCLIQFTSQMFSYQANNFLYKMLWFLSELVTSVKFTMLTYDRQKSPDETGMVFSQYGILSSLKVLWSSNQLVAGVECWPSTVLVTFTPLWGNSPSPIKPAEGRQF